MNLTINEITSPFRKNPRGLKNGGSNRCYANSCLQVFLSSNFLHKFIREHNNKNMNIKINHLLKEKDIKDEIMINNLDKYKKDIEDLNQYWTNFFIEYYDTNDNEPIEIEADKIILNERYSEENDKIKKKIHKGNQEDPHNFLDNTFRYLYFFNPLYENTVFENKNIENIYKCRLYKKIKTIEINKSEYENKGYDEKKNLSHRKIVDNFQTISNPNNKNIYSNIDDYFYKYDGNNYELSKDSKNPQIGKVMVEDRKDGFYFEFDFDNLNLNIYQIEEQEKDIKKYENLGINNYYDIYSLSNNYVKVENNEDMCFAKKIGQKMYKKDYIDLFHYSTADGMIEPTDTIEHLTNSINYKFIGSDDKPNINNIDDVNQIVYNVYKKAPPIIVLKLLRYTQYYDENKKKFINKKITDKVKINDTYKMKINGQEYIYVLKGINFHSGSNINGGHFVSFIKKYKNQNDYIWWLANDSSVSIKNNNGYVAELEYGSKSVLKNWTIALYERKDLIEFSDNVQENINEEIKKLQKNPKNCRGQK